MKDKNIYIFIGPKGCGKSHLAQLMAKEFAIDFVIIEDMAKDVKKDQYIDDESYLKGVFKAIESGIRHELLNKDKLIFESTGLSENFDLLLENLERDFHVITIGVYADNDTCLKRIQERNPKIEIEVTAEQLEEINQLIREKNIQTKFQIDNQDKSMHQLLNELSDIIENNEHL